MSEYMQPSLGVRCLRSSPIPSLIGFILVLLGGGAFGGGAIFAKKYFIELVDIPDWCPYFNYVIYGIVGAIGLFSLLTYILCAVSSGWNAVTCFNTARKSNCGRCCNMFFLVCLIVAVFLWALIACLSTYPIVSMAFLMGRDSGVEVARIGQFDASTRLMIEPSGQPEPWEAKPTRIEEIPGQPGTRVNMREESPSISMAQTDKSDQIDLSYYGLYKPDGTPLYVNSNGFYRRMRELFICACATNAGVLLILLGYIQFALCTAMNYARLQEARYYDPCDEVQW